MAANVMDAIMLLGDSITQGGWEAGGFAQRLVYVYARKLDVINRGLSGYNTEWALPVFKQIIAKKEEQPHVPAIVLFTIWFGANDACIPPSKQHVPLSEFSANLSYFINALKSPNSDYYSPRTRILLFTPPPINTYQRGGELASRDPPQELDRNFEVTRQYADAVKEVGDKEGVPVLDVWSALYNAADRDERKLEKYLNDGLHLNAEAYKIVFDALIAKIKREWPEIHYENLPMVFPGWADVDVKNLNASTQAKRPEI